MPTNFNSISVILNNIRSIRNSHGEARSSISCQDHVYAWVKQQSSWCNLSQNENVNKARLTYCTTVLLLYCASINGDRSLKYLTNLICFYIFKANFWSCFFHGKDPGIPLATCLIDDYWTYKIGPCQNGLPSYSLSTATSADGLAFRCGKASSIRSVGRQIIKVSTTHEIPNILLFFKIARYST